MSGDTMALIDRLVQNAPRAPLQPRFRRHWRAPKNSKGGFLSYEDLKAEEQAHRAAYYGPPQGPCASFHDTYLHGYPVCFCGWTQGPHALFRKADG